MAFVFGLVLSVSLLFCGKVGANPPLLESSKVVVNNLNRVVTNERLLEGADLDQLTHYEDERNGLHDKSFREVVRCYTDLLGECLAKHEPIPFNCRVFAAYAFSKFSEVGVNCQYLKIDDAERCAHAVVMMPQKEGERTKWYICDFLRAVETHNELRSNKNSLGNSKRVFAFYYFMASKHWYLYRLLFCVFFQGIAPQRSKWPQK